MADREKVMSWLESLAEPDWRDFHSDSEVQNIAKSALELLKAQRETIDELISADKALKLLEEQQEAVEPNLDVDEWRCGNCDHKLEHQELLGDNMLFHEQYNYCPNCGRGVQWK